MYETYSDYVEQSLLTERGSAGLGHPDYFDDQETSGFDESLHTSGTESAQRQLGLIAVKDMFNE